jgi:type II secretory pathway pseudopilin PulG
MEGKPMRRKGFTLLEICYVIGIIATLAAILFPVFARAREKARQHMCASHLFQINMALHLYAQDHKGIFPKANNDFAALLPYVKNRFVFWCPSDSHCDFDHYTPPGPTRFPLIIFSSYVLKGGLTQEDRDDTVIAGERLYQPDQGFHGSMVNVTYIGGMVKAVPVDTYVPVVKPRLLPDEHPQSTIPGPPIPAIPQNL